MAHADLRAAVQGAAQAFQEGQEHRALTLLTRVRDARDPGTVKWALLERLRGLLLIHLLREVEGTFALERADAVLDCAEVTLPTLDWLTDPPADVAWPGVR